MRNHPIVILRGIIKGIWESLSTFVFIVLLTPLTFTKGIIIYLSIQFVISLFVILNWWNLHFYIDGNNLILKKGIIFKKRISLPLSNITNVDLEQTFSDRIFNIFRVNVSSGSQTSDEFHGEILIMNREVAYEFRQSLLGSIGFSEDELMESKANIGHEITKWQLFLYGMTRNSLLPFIGFLFSFYFFVESILRNFDGELLEKVKESLGQAALSNYYLFVGAILTAFILGKLIVVMNNYFKYYGFRLWREEEKIHIQYGYFTKKKYSIYVDKIHAVAFKQSPVLQLMGYSKLEVSSVGYDGGSEGNSLLFPIGDETFLNNLLEDILPDYKLKKPLLGVQRSQKKFFVLIPSTITVGIVAVLGIIDSRFWYGLLIIPILIVGGICSANNIGFSISNTMLTLSKGSFYKGTHIIRVKSLQSVKKKQSYFQLANGIGTLEISYYTGTINLKRLSMNCYKEATSRMMDA